MTAHTDSDRYFSSVAEGYQEKVTSWPLSWLRARESSAVAELLGDVTGLRILELGCGSGYYTRQLTEGRAAQVIAVDKSGPMIEALKLPNVQGIVASASDIKIAETFDLILSAGMLEFVPDPAAVMANARGHAGEGTSMILLMPEKNIFGQLYRLFHLTHGVRALLLSHREKLVLFEKTGWKVDRVHRVFPFTVVFRLIAV